jgi:hypothetical protein
LARCDKEHKLCKHVSSLSPLPKRVIDVGLSTNLIKLVETKKDAVGRYVTLSYCWGTDQISNTTSSSMEERKTRIDILSLSKSFQDAINLTRRLNIQYIWIDSLCIIQDDPTDWEIESAKMAKIYELSFLTIAASSSSSGDHSFLARRRYSVWYPFTIKCSDGNSQPTIVRARLKPETGIHGITSRSQDPWDSRGWTLQEKLLSSRLISYSSYEMQWFCKTLLTCECEAELGADWNECPSSIFQVTSDHQAYMFWQVHVMDYSKRRLTYPSDKLPAISGLASRIHQVTGSEYFAGLWMGNFLKDLCWERVPPNENSKWKLPLLYRAPTFSWASVDGGIYWDEDTYYEDWTCHTTVLDKSYELLGTNRFGHVGNCTLELRSPCFEASLSSTQYCGHTFEYSLSLKGTIESFTADVLLEDFTSENSLGFHERSVRRSAKDVPPQLKNEQVLVLYLGCLPSYLENLLEIEDGVKIEKCRGGNDLHYFLVLGRSPRDFDAYERLGIMKAAGWPQLYEKTSYRTVSIR